jgi:hypothetical protein
VTRQLAWLEQPACFLSVAIDLGMSTMSPVSSPQRHSPGLTIVRFCEYLCDRFPAEFMCGNGGPRTLYPQHPSVHISPEYWKSKRKRLIFSE